MKLILASASPRRKELLEQIGLEFEVRTSGAEEFTTASQPGADRTGIIRDQGAGCLGYFDRCRKRRRRGDRSGHHRMRPPVC